MISRDIRNDHVRNMIDSEFTGREEYIESFRNSLTLKRGAKGYWTICNVYGPDGLGKTWLLHRLETIAREAKTLAAFVDQRAQNPLEMMSLVASHLEQQGSPLKNFSERYDLYCQHSAQLSTDPESPAGIQVMIGQASGEMPASVEVADRSAELKADYAFEPENLESALKLMPNQWESFVYQKIESRDEVDLALSPLRVLTPIFLADLGIIAQEKRIVIFLDGYGDIGRFLDKWLAEMFGGKYGKPPQIHFVIAGREQLQKEAWNQAFTFFRLKPFKDQDIRAYLKKKDLSDPQVVSALSQLSDGLPLLLAALASVCTVGPAAADLSPDRAVDTFVDCITEPVHKRVIVDAALPRSFNQDILETVVGKQDAANAMAWLQKLPFIRPCGEQWCFHSMFRLLLLEKKYHADMQEWIDMHERLAAIYPAQDSQAALIDGAAQRDAQKQALAREKMYHLLCSHTPRYLPEALNEFLRILEFDFSSAREWAAMIEEAGLDSSNGGLRRWGQRLLFSLDAFGEKRYEDTDRMFSSLAEYPGIDKSLLPLVLGWRGEVYRVRGQYEEALEDFNQALELDPELIEVLTLRGETYRLMGQEEDGMNNFNRALEIDADYSQALNGRGAIMFANQLFEPALEAFDHLMELEPSYSGGYALRGEAHRKLDDPENALEDFNQAAEMTVGYAPAIACRGAVLLQQDRFGEALRDLNRALTLRPNWSWALANRSATYQRMELYSDALKDVNRAIVMTPDFLWALINRSAIYRALGRYEDALEDLDYVLQKEPKSLAALALRGEILRQLGRLDEALEDFNAALQLDPTFVGGIAARAVLYRRMENFAEALVDLQRAAELDPSLVAAIAVQAETYRKMKDYEKALEFFDRAIEMKPDYAWAISGRGETYRRMGEYEKAVENFDKAIELDPKDPWTFTRRGMTYRLQDRCLRALADFNLALQTQPNFVGALALRGEVFRRVERYSDAIKDFNRAIELHPNDNWTIGTRGEAFFQMGQFSEALADYNHATLINSRDTWATKERGRTYRRMKRYTRGMDDFTFVIEIDPKDDMAIFQRAMTNVLMGAMELAEADLIMAIQLAQAEYEKLPDDWRNTINLAFYHLAKGSTKEAQRLYEEGLSGNPSAYRIREVAQDIEDFLSMFSTHRSAASIKTWLDSRYKAALPHAEDGEAIVQPGDV